ncbi:hypothetical protein Q9966_016700 [Columba livia]|nr:hypothetical protein Q9966_016700 [Columba livia]
MALESIRYERGSLSILNQRLLPQRLQYEPVPGVRRAWEAIRDMEVRGDRDIRDMEVRGDRDIRDMEVRGDRDIRDIRDMEVRGHRDIRDMEHMEGLLEQDRAQNRRIGAHGAQHLLQRLPPGSGATVLTHCNTGTLATAGYGTALDIDVWNPAFDVTPHELITGGIITEWGVFAPGELRQALAERGAAGGP